MCAISGSFDKLKLEELYKLNAYRGELSYSISSFKPIEPGKNEFMVLMKGEGKIPDNMIADFPSADNYYYITHSQAPTTNSDNIHPAVYGDAMLWHNGIIKQKTLSDGTWDTEWLLERVLDYGWSALSRVDGTFACVMYRSGSLYVFRNEISPLFVDDDLNISSTKLPGFESIKPNVVFKMDLKYKTLTPEAYFETMENPYYIPE